MYYNNVMQLCERINKNTDEYIYNHICIYMTIYDYIII